jgi:predicted  nucleic acid-binding Zn-ribbon protein
MDSEISSSMKRNNTQKQNQVKKQNAHADGEKEIRFLEKRLSKEVAKFRQPGKEKKKNAYRKNH